MFQVYLSCQMFKEYSIQHKPQNMFENNDYAYYCNTKNFFLITLY